MAAPTDRTVLTEAVNASITFRSGAWSLSGFALILLGGALHVLLGWFADGAGICDRAADLTSDAASLTWFLVIGVVLGRFLFALAGSRIMQSTTSGITGATREQSEAATAWRQVVTDLWRTPIEVLTIPGLLLVILVVLLQLARLPWVGPVLFFLLLPVLVYLAFGIVRSLARWLLAGHLIGAGLATEDHAEFPALSTAFAYLARDGLRVVGLRLTAFLVAFAAVLLRAAAIAALWGVAWLVAPGLLTGEFGNLMLVVAGWWLASLLLSACYAGRAAQYLILRRVLDGVPLAGSAEVSEPRSLEQMGFELVKRLDVLEEE